EDADNSFEAGAWPGGGDDLGHAVMVEVAQRHPDAAGEGDIISEELADLGPGLRIEQADNWSTPGIGPDGDQVVDADLADLVGGLLGEPDVAVGVLRNPDGVAGSRRRRDLKLKRTVKSQPGKLVGPKFGHIEGPFRARGD